MKHLSNLDQVVEQFSRLERKLDPFRNIGRRFPQLDEANSIVSQISKMGAGANLSKIVGSSKLMSLPKTALMDPGFLEKVSAFTKSWESVLEPIQQNLRVWDGLAAEINERSLLAGPMLEASQAWKLGVGTLVSRFDTAGILAYSDSLANRLLAPARSFTIACESLYRTIDEANGLAAEAARTRLEFLTEHWDASSEALGNLVEVPEEVEPPVEERQLGLLVERQEGTESSADDRKIAEAARSILQLTHHCNSESQLKAGPDVFKVTNRILAVYADFAWLKANSLTSLGEFVDCLYFLLYEAAGKDKLRFMHLFQAEECEVVWTVKYLRNKWIRHDLEHGTEKDIGRSYATLAEALKAAGSGSIPTSASEFRALQMRLLQMTEAFLRMLLERLKKV